MTRNKTKKKKEEKTKGKKPFLCFLVLYLIYCLSPATQTNQATNQPTFQVKQAFLYIILYSLFRFRFETYIKTMTKPKSSQHKQTKNKNVNIKHLFIAYTNL